MFNETDSLPQSAGARPFAPAPITGQSVMRDVPLVPIVPYAKSREPAESGETRAAFLKRHIGDTLKIKSDGASVHTGVLTEVGGDFFVVRQPRSGSLILFDVHAARYVKIYPRRYDGGAPSSA